ncbi:MAG: hypothetical protein K0R18_369 [Bacillales bacterium]|jgi:hypothetical protein|nr:hypothetical protein [Bacillales bacterium]
METMFKPGQRLKVTDNTGKPINQIQTLKILGITNTPIGPEYKVYIDNPDEHELLEFGKSAHRGLWFLDEAVEEKRIFVEVMEG